jgi:hypothetical protein
MFTPRTAVLPATAALVALALTAGAAPAHAEPTDDGERFGSFVASMGVDAATSAALDERFDALSDGEQERFLAATEADPSAVLQFDDAQEPTIVAAPTSPMTRASGSRYTATYPVRVSVLGIDTGTFNLRYVFEATSTAVTRNLECTGWFSGTAGFWSINQTTSNYISASTGTCKVIHRMSAFYKGSAWSANKEQAVSYRGTSLVSGYLKNI